MCLCRVHENSLSAITLENTLVVMSTVAPDAGRYYAQAVNDKNGENKTSQPITLSVESKYTYGFKQQTISPTQRCTSLQGCLCHQQIAITGFYGRRCSFITCVQLFTSNINSKQQLHNSWLSQSQHKHR